MEDQEGVLRIIYLGLGGIISKCIAEKIEHKLRGLTFVSSRLKRVYQLQLNKNRSISLC